MHRGRRKIECPTSFSETSTDMSRFRCGTPDKSPTAKVRTSNCRTAQHDLQFREYLRTLFIDAFSCESLTDVDRFYC